MRVLENMILTEKYIKAGLLLVIAAAVLLAFQTIRAPFFLDDIPEMEHVESFSSPVQIFAADAFGFKRPVKNLIFMIVSQAGESSAVVGHAVSMFLYVAAIFAVFFWLRLWLGKSVWSVVGTAIWALSPTLVSSIVWLSCANIMVSLIFILSALICWEYARRKQECGENRQSYMFLLLSMISYVFAFGAYESAIVFPVMAVLQDVVLKRRRIFSKASVCYAGVAAVSLLLLVMRGRPATPSNFNIMGVTAGWQLSCSSAYFLLSHIWQWFWPFGNQEILGTFVWGRSVPLWMLGAAWAVLLFLAVACIALFRRLPEIAAGMLLAVAALLPMCNVLPLYSGPFADYYLTLSAVGLSLALVSIIKNLAELFRMDSVSSRKRVLIFVIFTMISLRFVCAGASFNWSRAWKDPAVLLTRSIGVRPYAYPAQASLAHIMLMRNQLDRAEKLAMRSISETDGFVLPMNVMGSVTAKKGRYEESVMWYEKTLAIEPDNMYARLSLAVLFDDNLNDKEQAERCYRIVIDRSKNNEYRKTAYTNLSIIMGMAGRYEEAVDLLEKALHNFPDSKNLKHNLQITKHNMHKTAESPAQK